MMSQYTHVYIGIPIWVFGTVGNILTLVVCRQKNTRKMKITAYLQALAVSDTVVLQLYLLPLILFPFVPESAGAGVPPLVCNLGEFLLGLFADFSVWILVGVTFHRLLSLWFPIKANQVCTPKTPWFVLTGIFLSMVIKNFHVLFVDRGRTVTTVINENQTMIMKSNFYQSSTIGINISQTSENPPINRNNTEGRHTNSMPFCIPQNAAHWEFIFFTYYYINLILSTIIPFLILLICNICIIGKLACRRRHHNIISSSTAGNADKTNHVSIMLLLTSFLFICLLSPVYIEIGMLRYAIESASQYVNMNPGFIASYLQILNYAINFLLYAVSSPAFRADLKLIMCRKQRVNVHPSTQ